MYNWLPGSFTFLPVASLYLMLMTWYEQIPKVELHVHLEGSIPHDALFELIQKYGGDPEVPDVAALEKRFAFRDFPHFIATWAWKNRYLREYDDFQWIAKHVAKNMADQNIRYAEMFFTPSNWAARGLSVNRIAESVRVGLSKVPEIEVALIADFPRGFDPKTEEENVERLSEVKDLDIVGIGIGGPEHLFPPGRFKKMYEKARKLGFHTTAHAGEGAGAASIWEAINELEVERIGHGTRAYEDPQLVDYLKEKRIPLEMCPVSNFRTKVVPSIAGHPIRDYFKKGLLVTANSDDPKMFDTSLPKEYEALVEHCGFDRKDICQLILNAIESSWMKEVKKLALEKRFRENALWVS